jgi:hypothetical protein
MSPWLPPFARGDIRVQYFSCSSFSPSADWPGEQPDRKWRRRKFHAKDVIIQRGRLRNRARRRRRKPERKPTGWLGAGYTCDFVCDFMSDLLQIADAICCICDLVSHTELLPFTRSMRYGVTIWFCDLLCRHGIAHQIADTLNCICDLVQKKDRKWFLSDTKSQIHQIASAICSKLHALNRSCNQPLTVVSTAEAMVFKVCDVKG